jgi:hypothetical protein
MVRRKKFIGPPKLFGCTCFHHDYRPSTRKLDPYVVKCVLLGYISGQQRYKCWNLLERCMCVSMDVSFQEARLIYDEKIYMSMLFEELDHLQPASIDQEGDKITISMTHVDIK